MHKYAMLVKGQGTIWSLISQVQIPALFPKSYISLNNLINFPESQLTLDGDDTSIYLIGPLGNACQPCGHYAKT